MDRVPSSKKKSGKKKPAAKRAPASKLAPARPRTLAIKVGVAALALYVVVALVFSSRFLPGTSVDGIDASWRTPDDVAAAAQDVAASYELQVTGDGIDLTVSGADMGLSVDADAFAQGVSAHVPGWLWPLRLLLSRSYEVGDGVSCQAGVLRTVVGSAVATANARAWDPHDATLAYDDDTDSFAVVDEQLGTAVDAKRVRDRATAAVGVLRAQVELGDDDLEQPALVADDARMGAALAAADARADLTLDLTLRGETIFTVDADLMRTWMTVGPDYTVTGDLDLITTWAREELSAQVDTVGTARTYVRANDGKQVEVYGGGTYGWNVDSDKLAAAIVQRVEENSAEPIRVPMKGTAANLVKGGQDWPARYLDVDLGEQYVRLFDDDADVIWESECVSGDLANDNATVTGVFTIENKVSPMTLVGLDYDGDGEPDYENDVQYWMPFYGGYGLHDALWRDYFGSDAYVYNGSHGCINLPYYAAELLYGIIRVGDVVVVHY